MYSLISVKKEVDEDITLGCVTSFKRTDISLAFESNKAWTTKSGEKKFTYISFEPTTTQLQHLKASKYSFFSYTVRSK